MPQVRAAAFSFFHPGRPFFSKIFKRPCKKRRGTKAQDEWPEEKVSRASLGHTEPNSANDHGGARATASPTGGARPGAAGALLAAHRQAPKGGTMVPRPNTSPLGAAALLWAAALLVLGSADAAAGMSINAGGGSIRGVRTLVSD